MTRDEIREVVLSILAGIAPEIDVEEIRPGADLRDELDIDSMDFLNLVTALGERLQIDIPEIDYPNLATFGHAVDYLAQRVGAVA